MAKNNNFSTKLSKDKESLSRRSKDKESLSRRSKDKETLSKFSKDKETLLCSIAVKYPGSDEYMNAEFYCLKDKDCNTLCHQQCNNNAHSLHFKPYGLKLAFENKTAYFRNVASTNVEVENLVMNLVTNAIDIEQIAYILDDAA